MAESVPDATPAGFPPAPRTRAVIREWDRTAIEDYGIPGAVLMENAGAAATRVILHLLGADPSIAPRFEVLCGPGNNGGDGFVVARYLHDAGLPVRVTILGEAPRSATSDAGIHWNVLRRYPVESRALGAPPPLPPPQAPGWREATLIDALFGTGLSRELTSPHRDWIEAMAGSGRPVIALDVPSGLDADTGAVLGAAAPARHTITFAALKVGFGRGRGPELCGRVHVVPIGLPSALWMSEAPAREPPPEAR